MKTFSGARVQFMSVDPETDEKVRFSLGDIKEDAAAEVIREIGTALGSIVDGELEQTTLTQTFEIA